MAESKHYDFRAIEAKWQNFWREKNTFRVEEDASVPPERRRYVLDMFPYPSAAGLHVGHPEGYTATDIYCRYLRMKGFHVLHPMGFDSFGLPAENYAIKTGVHPRKTTEENIAAIREQIKAFGFSYDWERDVSTHAVDYYRWTQWIFLQLYKKGLAYETEAPINWCPSCKTGLANEEVKEGLCERCGHRAERRFLRQWLLKITAYADRLLEDLEDLDWPEPIKQMQRNWIGRSEGANVYFALEGRPEERLEVYTTRPDTLFGATYMVLAPEHPLTASLTTPEQKSAVEDYVRRAALKSDLERTDLVKEKTGVFTGAYAVNPVNEEKIPVWISDYILASYGTGAIMAVPAHDERDRSFAEKFSLPIRTVVRPPDSSSPGEKPAAGPADSCFTGEGVSVDSGFLSGLKTPEAKEAVIARLEEQGRGRRAVNYKLRDWLFSRQRYWGEPIPLVHCSACGVVPLPEDELPLVLPEVESYRPSGTGESPLVLVEDWVSCSCPSCGAPARRETNTMPQWAGSCWYYLRYLDPKNTEAFVSKEKADYWLPVDLYVGGAEHAVLHLLYARFWHKVLFDLDLVPQKEPFLRLVNQGLILGDGGVKMSKTLGNVVNPNEILAEYGADSFRIYEMFMGPLESSKPWATSGLAGIFRFLQRVCQISRKPLSRTEPPKPLVTLLHKTIKKVSSDTETLNFNTAVSQMMVYVNALSAEADRFESLWKPFVLLLAPYAPHLAEELWEDSGASESLAREAWPSWEEALTRDAEKEIVVQINGKVRRKFLISAERLEQDKDGALLKKEALEDEKIREFLRDQEVIKVIAVPGKLVNIVARR